MANTGMGFESLLDYTNARYQNLGMAIINKRPTPVKVTRSSGSKVIAGFFEKKSTVDYDGLYLSRRLDFEAKSVEKFDRFDLNRIEPHQYEHLEQSHTHGSIAFVLIEFIQRNETFLLPFTALQYYKRAADMGGRKSIMIDDLEVHGYLVKPSTVPLDYLSIVRKVWNLGVS